MLDDQVPIQPVEGPSLCAPYEEPIEHWLCDRESGAHLEVPAVGQLATGKRPNALAARSTSCSPSKVGMTFRWSTDADVNSKHQGSRHWGEVVNDWRERGKWAFLVCRNAQRLKPELGALE